MEVRLTCESGPSVGQTRQLGVGLHSLGRGPQNSLSMELDEAVSARHAELCVRREAALLVDVGSENGTWLNGVELAVPTVLASDDLLQLGQSTWRVTCLPAPPDEPTAAAAPPLLDEPRLQVLAGPQQGLLLTLASGLPLVVGRGPKADLVLDDPLVSREHATFFRQGDEVAVLDNDSVNGVTVNGEKVRMTHLAEGDRVQIGRTVLRFQAAGQPVATAPPAEPPPPPPPPSLPSEPLGRLGEWLLLREIGRGGMGRVFAARRPGGEVLALKVVVFKGLDEARAARRRRRFGREVEVLQRIRHDNVVGFREAGEVDGRPCLAMELLEGEDLGSALRRLGRLPYAEVERILFQLCGAVAAVHAQGIIHRDLKPSNVVLHGPQRQVKLTDFGIARPVGEADLEGDEERLTVAGDDSITGVGRHPGTPFYMSPEGLRGEPAEMRSDIWQLGVVMYQLLAGRRPFEGTTSHEVATRVDQDCPAELPADLPQHLCSAVYRCLRKDPAGRFGSAIELMDALHDRRVEQLLPVGAAGPLPRPWTRCPHCRTRLAPARERCPVCQTDLYPFASGQILQVEAAGQTSTACGACGRPLAWEATVCLGCQRELQFPPPPPEPEPDFSEQLTDDELANLAARWSTLKSCPWCGAGLNDGATACSFCGLVFRPYLLGRVTLATVADREQPCCGHCGSPLDDPAQPACEACGLDFSSGRLPDATMWHAAAGA
ncbi:MAG: protein kinase [Fimbriimonadaceae bacterium]|nr:protein kinase [Fimbriimonadaceae bacterium]